MNEEDFIECNFPEYIINIAENYIKAKPDKDIKKGSSHIQFSVSNIAKFEFDKWIGTSAKFELVLWPKHFYVGYAFAYESDMHYCIDTDHFPRNLSFEEMGDEFLKRLKSYTYHKFKE